VAHLLELLAGMKRNLGAVRDKGAAAAPSARRAPVPPKDRGKLVAVRPVKDKARKSGS
jgi:hypothetical protein